MVRNGEGENEMELHDLEKKSKRRKKK